MVNIISKIVIICMLSARLLCKETFCSYSPFTPKKNIYCYGCGIYYFFQNSKSWCRCGEKMGSEWIFLGQHTFWWNFRLKVAFSDRIRNTVKPL